MPRKPASKPVKRGHKAVGEQLTIFELMTKKAEVRDTIRALLSIERDPKVWRGIVATPPGSLLETVVRQFKKYTDFPLEVPFFICLSYVSTHLLKNNVSIKFLGKTIRPDLWTIVLAHSGAGKTESDTLLAEASQFERMPEAASAAKFVELLRDNNKGIWIQDEFGKFLFAMENLTHMAEMRAYLLKLYDGKKIERNTKKESVIIDDPTLTILGLTQIDNFTEFVNTSMMVDGFAQRFNYVVARPDPERPMENFPTYRQDLIRPALKREWEKLLKVPLHRTYTVSPKGKEGFESAFQVLLPANKDVPPSFFRRIMWRGVRYALMYHILLGKESPSIDEYDMGWAGRILHLHLQDVKWIIEQQGMGDLEKIIRKAEDVMIRFANEGKKFSPRDLISHVRGIRNVAEARAILSMINGGEQDL